MSGSNSEPVGRKFQLTDSLLRKILNEYDYERIKIIEPVILLTPDASIKQLKSPGYRHAALSKDYLHVLNSPARSISDLLISVSIEKVRKVELLHDVVDFLQGNLQEDAQHIRLTCNKSAKYVANESVISKESFKSVSLVALSGQNNEFKEVFIGQPFAYHHLENSNSEIHHKPIKVLQRSEADHRSPSCSKLIHSRRPSRRPLPKPVIGTETLNASFTSAMMINSKKVSNASLSCEDLSKVKSIHHQPLKEHNLNAFIRPKCPSTQLSRSWNDELSPMLTSNSSLSVDLDSKVRSLSVSSDESISLNQSLSSKLFKFVKGSQTKDQEDVSAVIKSSSSIKSDEGSDFYIVDVFTVSKNSNLFNVLKEAWINALINSIDVTAMKSQSSSSEYMSKSTMDSDTIVQRFTSLKEEIMRSNSNEQMFLLTKELKYACKRFMLIKQMLWKSINLLGVYMNGIKCLIAKKTRIPSQKMDEMDSLILYVELLAHLFQDSEMLSSRNAALNENGASLSKEIIDCISLKIDDDLASYDQEIKDLVYHWYNSSSYLLYEIIHAAYLSSWNCNLYEKSFDVSFVADVLSTKKLFILKIVDHIIKYLTRLFSDLLTRFGTDEDVVKIYKFVTILRFFCMSCDGVVNNIQINYQEEVKYYLCKKDIYQKLPTAYPLTNIMINNLQELLRVLIQ